MDCLKDGASKRGIKQAFHGQHGQQGQRGHSQRGQNKNA